MQMGFALVHILSVAFGVKAWGRFLLRGRLAEGSGVLRAVYETVFGLGLLSYFLFLACSFHWISKPFLWGLWISLIPFAVLEVLFLWKTKGTTSLKVSGPLREVVPFALGILIYLAGILALAALPVSDRDEMIYQLEIPRQILKAHGFRFFADNFYAYFPQFQNLLMMFGLGTVGEGAARLYHTLSGALLALALFGYGRRTLSPSGCRWALVLFFTAPSVMILLPLGYVDIAYSLYGFLSLILLLEFHEKNRIRDAVLAGLFAGFAAATKYTGIQYVILLLILSLGISFQKKRISWKGLGAFIAMSVLGIAPYLIRNKIVTGWPLFPFASSFPLNPAIHWDAARAELYLGWLGQFGTKLGQASFGDSLFAPFLVFVQGRFNEPQFYEGVLGPVFLLTPLFLYKKEKNPTIWIWIIFSLLFLYYWALTTKQIRFLIPVLPWLCLLLAYGLEKQHGFWKGTVLLLILFNISTAIFQISSGDPWAYLLGKESRAQYLSRQIPQFSIYQQVNQKLSGQEKVFLIGMKNYGYYLERPWTGDFVFERYRVDEILKSQSVENLTRFFKDQKIHYLLVDEIFIHSPDWGMLPEDVSIWEKFLKEKTHLEIQDRSFSLYRFFD